MDKNSMFRPDKDEAFKIAHDYWAGITKDKEKLMDEISQSIINSAKMGSYTITKVIKKEDVPYIKEKLEDVGYKVEVSSKDSDYDFLRIIFEK